MTKVAYSYTEPKDKVGAAVKANKFLADVANNVSNLVSAKGAEKVAEVLRQNELMANELADINVTSVWNTGITRDVRGAVYAAGEKFRFTFPENEKSAKLKAAQIKAAVAGRKFQTVDGAAAVVDRITDNCELMANALAGFNVQETWENQLVRRTRTGLVLDLDEE